MALVRVQGTGRVTAPGAASVALTFAAPPAVGNGIVVLATLYQTSGSLTVCSDNRGNAYVKVVDHTANPMQAAIHYCGKVTASGAPFTVTLAFTSLTGQFEAAAVEVGGVGGGLVVDQIARALATSAAPSSSATPPLTGSEVFVAAAHSIGANQTSLVVQAVSPAWIEEYENLNYSATIAGEGDSHIVTGAAGTTQTAIWTASASATWAAVLAAFKGTTGGASRKRGPRARNHAHPR